MIFFWSGFGFLVPIIGFGILIFAPLLINEIFGDPAFYFNHTWAKCVVVAIAAAVIWVIGRKLNGKPGRVVIDKETQKELVLKSYHDFMFIRMEYWAPIMIFVIGLIVIAKK